MVSLMKEPAMPTFPRNWSQRLQRRVAAAGVLAITVSLALAGPAEAITVAPMTMVYDQVVNGDYFLVGNGNLVCDSTKNSLTGTSPDFTCAQLHNGTVGTSIINDFKFMKYADVDTNATTVNSSSATVTVPSAASGSVGVTSGITGVLSIEAIDDLIAVRIASSRPSLPPPSPTPIPLGMIMSSDPNCAPPSSMFQDSGV